MKKEEQFIKLVTENKATIYTVCYMFSQHREEVDDLFQDVLINLWRGFDKFRGESAISTWIWRVSLNTCITSISKLKKGNRELNAEADPILDEGVENGQQIKQLYERIRQLGPIDRGIVLLWLEGMSYEEIAQVIGTSVKNISVRLYRIKQELKRLSNTNNE